MKISLRRIIGAFGQSGFGRKRPQLDAGVLGRKPHRIAHVIKRARTERAHIVRRHIGVGVHDPHILGLDAEHLADDQREGGVGALPHVDGAGVERGAAVSRDIDDRDRGGGRDYGLEPDGDAAAAPHRPGAALERLVPAHARHQRSNTSLMAASCSTVPLACGRPLRNRFLRRNCDRIDAEFAGNQIGVALKGPDQLRHAEAAQRTGRCPVGVKLVGIDADIVDVVGTGRGEAGFLRNARADIGIGAAVPTHLAVRATMRPSLATPLLMRNVVGCLVIM